MMNFRNHKKDTRYIFNSLIKLNIFIFLILADLATKKERSTTGIYYYTIYSDMNIIMNFRTLRLYVTS